MKNVEAGSICYSSGWGSTKAAYFDENSIEVEMPKRLQAAALKSLSFVKCKKVMDDYISNHSAKPFVFKNKDNAVFNQILNFSRDYDICVEGGKKAACVGDSGGPLVCEGDF